MDNYNVGTKGTFRLTGGSMASDKDILEQLRKLEEKKLKADGKKVESYAEFTKKFREYLSSKGIKPQKPHVCRPYKKLCVK